MDTFFFFTFFLPDMFGRILPPSSYRTNEKQNDQGLTFLCALLTLTVIPTIQHGPQVFSTIEGIPVTLPCRAIGVPTPEISWAKVCFAVVFLVGSYSVSLTPPPNSAFFQAVILACSEARSDCNICEKESNANCCFFFFKMHFHNGTFLKKNCICLRAILHQMIGTQPTSDLYGALSL